MTSLAWMRPKLAELCGLFQKYRDTPQAVAHEMLYRRDEKFPDSEDYAWPLCSIADWRPDEDVAQAIRCLETMRSKCWDWRLDYRADFMPRCHLGTTRGTWAASGDTPAQSACLAIAAALGWEEG